MARRPKPSIFLNVAAWLLLGVALGAGVVALVSAAAGPAQTLKVGRLELRTTSTAALVMVVASIPLWVIIRAAVAGRIRVFDVGERPSRLERWAPALETVSAAAAVVGIVLLLLRAWLG